jgi:alkylation response protein AidB-like acyl-CoA dehydrogenase
MDFNLDTEQAALRDILRGLFKNVDHEQRLAALASGSGFDDDLWRRGVEMGLLGLPFAEEDGGVGAGPVEVAVVCEQLGRANVRSPYIDAVVVAGGLIAAHCGTEMRRALLSELASGQERVIPALLEPGGRDPFGCGGLVASGDLVDGVKEPVPWGGCADAYIVTAVRGDQPALLRVKRGLHVRVREYTGIDGARVAQVRFDNAPATLLGEGEAIVHALAQVAASAKVALCHEALGIMETQLQMTVEYLRTREQFGRPLKNFQSLSFRAADMYVALELARSAATWALMVLADPSSSPHERVEAAARAKLQVGAGMRLIGQEAIQLHGGIGMTTELPIGHMTARLTTIEQLWGSRHDQRDLLAPTARDLTVDGAVGRTGGGACGG